MHLKTRIKSTFPANNTKEFLKQQGFFPETLPYDKSSVIAISHKGRTYNNLFSVFILRIKDGQIVYASCEANFTKKKDAESAQKLLHKHLSKWQTKNSPQS